MGGRGKPAFTTVNAGSPLRLFGLGQPVKRGETSFLPQRWNDRRNVFGLVAEPDWNVTFTTRRWTPSRSFVGLTRSAITEAFFVFLTFLMTLPSSTKVAVAILLPRIRALNARAWQPDGPSSRAWPGTTRAPRTACAGGFRTVVAAAAESTTWPRASRPTTLAWFSTPVSPTAVATEQVKLHTSPGSSVPGEPSPPLPSSVTGSPLHC